MPPTPSKKLFGTDGIRGTFGRFPMDRETIYAAGRAIKTVLKPRQVIIGRDTRQSGEEVEKILANAMGTDIPVVSAGIFPTPGLSYITRQNPFDWGIMITASHNPYGDNGIKLFNHQGEKLAAETETEIERAFEPYPGKIKTPVKIHPVDRALSGKYQSFLTGLMDPLKNQSYRVLVDCANGATSGLAPEIFNHARWKIDFINTRPDGQNINKGCGSNHPAILTEEIKKRQAHWGIAFDGDGDRVIIVDREGNILNGDTILYLLSRYLLPERSGDPRIVVATVMSNLGLEKALEKDSIKLERSAVGDRNVYREMVRHDSILGGEESGHIILRKYLNSGDGMLTAIMFFRALQELDLDPDTAYRQLELFPQKTSSFRIREHRNLSQWQQLKRMIDQFGRNHGENSRVVIRYSGTEPKIRIMIESRDKAVVNEESIKFEKYIRSEIGG